jgi:hypothetical protein
MNLKKINEIYNVTRTEMYTHYIIVSSLDIFPKSPVKMIRKMFKVNNAITCQFVNFLSKRFSLTYIKKSHKIYINTYINDANLPFNLKIQPKEEQQSLLDQTFYT